MNAPDILCSHCGRSNRFERLWCEGCQASLSLPEDEPAAADLAEKESTRKRLYQDALSDLHGLIGSGEVTSESVDAIDKFYRHQLSLIEQRASEWQREQAVKKLVTTARKAAHAGQYHRAVDILRQGALQYAKEYPFEASLGELQERIRLGQLEQRQRKVVQLLEQAAQLRTLGLLQEAMEKLALAHELDPSSESVAQARKEIDEELAAERAGIPEEAEANSEDLSVSLPAEEEIPLAVLVQPNVPSDAVTVTDEAGSGTPSGESKASIAATTSVATQVVQPTDGSEFSVASQADLAPKIKAAPPQAVARRRSFAEEEEIPSATQRLIDSASKWSSVLKPFLVDNVGWFVGAFLVIAGFVVLIVTFWGNIEQNRVLMHSIVYFSLAATTSMFFAMAYFMRLRYPQLESSSNVLLVIVALLIPLVFAAAVLTTLVPVSPSAALVMSSFG